MPKALAVKFQGICAFIKKPGGKIQVVLPEAGGKVLKGVRSVKPHRAFLRWERADADRDSTLVADKKESNRTYGVAVLQNNETLSIDGPIQSGPLVVRQSFIAQVPPMDARSGSGPQTSSRIAASIEIDRGEVEAEPTERGHRWVFKPLGKTRVPPEEVPGAEEFSNNVLWRLKLKSGSTVKVRIHTSRGDLVIRPGAKGVVQVTIGNLEKLLPVVKKSTRRPQDVDFLFQYEVARQPLPIKKRPIPTRVTYRRTKGATMECFAARWGSFKPGVQT
jgi:hypothetical protein